MSLPLKVLWSEGLAIGPQHFQQQDRYHEGRLQKLAAALNCHAWGVQALRWNADALKNNLLKADAMALVFQDGEIYDAPAADELPPPFELDKLPLDEQHFTFYAAVPALKPHGGNLLGADAAHHDARYARTGADTPDLFTDALSSEVAFLKKKVTLLPERQSRSAYVSFPLVRLRRLAAGGFEIDPGFTPPALSVDAAPGLQLMLENLLGKMNVKIEELYSRHRRPSQDVFEVHSGDISSFWMLHTISTASASLTHCARYRQHHPETLFERMMLLAGGLMTFSTRYKMAELPEYRHEDFAPAFARLDAIVRDLLDTIISSRYFTIPLVEDENRNSYHRGTLDAARIDGQTMLCLAVNADMPALELVAAVPLRFKVGSPEMIERMVSLALSGVELSHMAQVPPEVPVRPNTYYFSLGSKSELYEAMLKAQAITVYVPTGMKNLKLELLGIKG